MSTLSPLQALPLHVAKLIVNHFVRSSPVLFLDTRANRFRTVLRPLLWVCHNLRAIALPLYCSRFKLFIYSKSPDVLGVRNLLSRDAFVDYRECNYLGHPTHHLARELEIELDERAVYSGKALRMLSTAPYDGSPFSQARKFALIFVPDEMDEAAGDVDTDPLTVEANVAAFVQLVKQMAPKVSEIRVQPAYEDDIEVHGHKSIEVDHRFSDLVSRLFQLVGSIEYGQVIDYSMPIELRLDSIHNLAHLKLDAGSRVDDIYQFIHLARRNAQTLQSLCMRSEEEKIDFSGLVQYADGRLVTYPCLRKLQLDTPPVVSILQQREFPGAVPFPSLRILIIKCVYPFNDDTLLRGNAATLEVLEMELTLSMVSMLRKYSVFTPASHPKLQCVNIYYFAKFTPDAFASMAEVAQFALSIGPEAPVRVFSGVYSVNELLPSLSYLGDHSPIQVLSISSATLGLADAIALIKSLPLLTDLCTGYPKPGSIPADFVKACLPGYAQTNYTPIGKRLLHWRFSDYGTRVTEDIAFCALVLALMCPNLNSIDMAHFERKQFMQLIKECIASDELKSYAPRLRRLFNKR